MGYSSSKEYAELEWPIDTRIALIWVFWYQYDRDDFKRRERHFILQYGLFGHVCYCSGLHIFNSLSIPVSPNEKLLVYAGVQDLVQWWYGHNAVAS
jgi:cbb3-type cytochrome oxidase subunit 1